MYNSSEYVMCPPSAFSLHHVDQRQNSDSENISMNNTYPSRFITTLPFRMALSYYYDPSKMVVMLSSVCYELYETNSNQFTGFIDPCNTVSEYVQLTAQTEMTFLYLN